MTSGMFLRHAFPAGVSTPAGGRRVEFTFKCFGPFHTVVRNGAENETTHPSAFTPRPADNLELSVNLMFKILGLWEAGSSTLRTHRDMVSVPTGQKTCLNPPTIGIGWQWERGSSRDMYLIGGGGVVDPGPEARVKLAAKVMWDENNLTFSVGAPLHAQLMCAYSLCDSGNGWS